MSRAAPLLCVYGLLIVLAAALGCDRQPDDMALVPEGKFLMGAGPGSHADNLRREVVLDAFYMDKHEVTNGDYKRFVDKEGHREPRNWAIRGYDEDLKDHPVVFVSYKDAEAYCTWMGKRLPTEEEWEKAARGTDGRVYPWGNEFKRDRANTSISGIVGTSRVGRYEEGKSPYGLYDMAGNVWEWTSSDYKKGSKVVKGGSWGLSHRFSRAFARVGYGQNTRINNLGFRCARDM